MARNKEFTWINNLILTHALHLGCKIFKFQQIDKKLHVKTYRTQWDETFTSRPRPYKMSINVMSTNSRQNIIILSWILDAKALLFFSAVALIFYHLFLREFRCTSIKRFKIVCLYNKSNSVQEILLKLLQVWWKISATTEKRAVCRRPEFNYCLYDSIVC